MLSVTGTPQHSPCLLREYRKEFRHKQLCTPKQRIRLANSSARKKPWGESPQGRMDSTLRPKRPAATTFRQASSCPTLPDRSDPRRRGERSKAQGPACPVVELPRPTESRLQRRLDWSCGEDQDPPVLEEGASRLKSMCSLRSRASTMSDLGRGWRRKR